MSRQAVAQLLEKALTDKEFSARLKNDFDGAIAGHNLTQDEIAALKSGDNSKLSAMGVEERLSKSAGSWSRI